MKTYRLAASVALALVATHTHSATAGFPGAPKLSVPQVLPSKLAGPKFSGSQVDGFKKGLAEVGTGLGKAFSKAGTTGGGNGGGGQRPVDEEGRFPKESTGYNGGADDPKEPDTEDEDSVAPPTPTMGTAFLAEDDGQTPSDLRRRIANTNGGIAQAKARLGAMPPNSNEAVELRKTLSVLVVHRGKLKSQLAKVSRKR